MNSNAKLAMCHHFWEALSKNIFPISTEMRPYRVILVVRGILVSVILSESVLGYSSPNMYYVWPPGLRHEFPPKVASVLGDYLADYVQL